jgi:hypothetical protein
MSHLAAREASQLSVQQRRGPQRRPADTGPLGLFAFPVYRNGASIQQQSRRTRRTLSRVTLS